MHVDHDVLDRLQTLLASRPSPLERTRAEVRAEHGKDEAISNGAASDVDDTIDRFSPSGDWDRLIDQVQSVAQHFRTTEKRIHLREVRLEQLLGRAEQELNAAAERVRIAEARAGASQAWAEQEIAAAGRRAAAAEERARALDAIFARLREVVLAETPREAEVILFERQKPAGNAVPPAQLHKVA